MATIKSCTDIEQSRKLAEILPSESADMYYCYGMDIHTKKWDYDITPTIIDVFNQIDIGDIPCWSLAALLDVLPKKYYPVRDHDTDLTLSKPKDKWYLLYWDATGMQDGEQTLADNPVDACYEMVLKLHKLKLL